MTSSVRVLAGDALIACCQSFETTRIVAVCPLCARSDHPIEVGGELSGT